MKKKVEESVTGFLDPNSPETQAESERGRAVLKATLRLLAAEPNEKVRVGNREFTACYRDGLFYRDGVKPRVFFHLGEVLVMGFKGEAGK